VIFLDFWLHYLSGKGQSLSGLTTTRIYALQSVSHNSAVTY